MRAVSKSNEEAQQLLVSVVMPAYNVAPYVESAVRSVLSQTHDALELIVVDDASTDATAAVLSRLSEEDERVRVFYREKNGGAARCRNMALEHANGDYVAFLDSDDYWEPRKLERQLEAVHESGLRMCCCSYFVSASSGSESCEANDVFEVPKTVSYDDLLKRNYFSCSTLMVERALAMPGMFDSAACHEDYAAWLRLARVGGVACGVREPLATYRVRPGSRSSSKVASACGRWRVLRDYTDEPFARRALSFAGYAVGGCLKYGKLALRKRSSRG